MRFRPGILCGKPKNGWWLEAMRSHSRARIFPRNCRTWVKKAPLSLVGRLNWLKDTDRVNSNLSFANLRLADLRRANVSNGQLLPAAHLVGAIMPIGTEMTEECREEFKEGDFRCASP